MNKSELSSSNSFIKRALCSFVIWLFLSTYPPTSAALTANQPLWEQSEQIKCIRDKNVLIRLLSGYGRSGKGLYETEPSVMDVRDLVVFDFKSMTIGGKNYTLKITATNFEASNINGLSTHRVHHGPTTYEFYVDEIDELGNFPGRSMEFFPQKIPDFLSGNVDASIAMDYLTCRAM